MPDVSNTAVMDEEEQQVAMTSVKELRSHIEDLKTAIKTLGVENENAILAELLILLQTWQHRENQARFGDDQQVHHPCLTAIALLGGSSSLLNTLLLMLMTSADRHASIPTTRCGGGHTQNRHDGAFLTMPDDRPS